MSIKISGCLNKYTFTGPFFTTGVLKDKSGVYAIFCLSKSKYELIDVGESSNVKTRAENHDRSGCWEDNCDGMLLYAVLYTKHGKKPTRTEIKATKTSSEKTQLNTTPATDEIDPISKTKFSRKSVIFRFPKRKSLVLFVHNFSALLHVT